MTTPPDIRPRIERLLRGERRAEDAHRIFQWQRGRTKGRAPAVKDVGDFIGHRDERTEGVAWDQGINSFNMVEYHRFALTAALPPPTVEQLKAATRSCLRERP